MLVLVALATCSRAADGPAASPPPSTSADLTKLDPVVASRLAGGVSQAVILLGTRQLLTPPAGFAAFAQANAAADRRTLRASIVRQLRGIARAEQEALLAALAIGEARVVRRFWLVNAVALVLSHDELVAATRHPGVRYVYPAEEGIASPIAIADAPPVAASAPPPPRRAGAPVPWNVRRIGAERTWNELGVTGRGVLVAVIDGGVELSHPDLRDNLWQNAREAAGNSVDDDRNGYVDDVHGIDASTLAGAQAGSAGDAHATFVAGIIAGNGAGGTATGVAPGARVMSIRGGMTATGAVLAFQYALDQGADIANMSFSLGGLGQRRGFWRLLCEQAIAAGLVLVGGAGNAGLSASVPTQIVTPKDVPAVITVGGVDSLDRLVPFSSTGPVEWSSITLYADHALPAGLSKPDVVAFPGPAYPILRPGGGYIDPNTSVQGNSFSGPHAAGIAALMLEANPALPAWRVKELMESTARDIDARGRDVRTGAGRLDAFAATSAARSLAARQARGPS